MQKSAKVAKKLQKNKRIKMANNKTETVVFLGAGISYIAGVPIQSEILKEICII